MMSLEKTQASMNTSLDVLKLVDDIAAECLRNVNSSFYTNGNLSSDAAIKNLKKIQGRMEVLRTIVASSRN